MINAPSGGPGLSVDDHLAADFGPSPMTSPMASPIPSIPEVVAKIEAELPGIVSTDDVGHSPKISNAALARQKSAGSNLNSIIDTTARKPRSEDHLQSNRATMGGHGGPHLPPGHFVSQVAASPRPAHRMRRTSSMPLEPDVEQEEDEVSMVTPKKDAVRVSLEGVAQLGQLLCRMMLFPIFRSNNEYLHWKKIFRTIVRIRLPDDCRRKSTTGRATLARVLLAYSQHNKEVGYCQSLNFIGAHLLLLMNKNEEDAFAALCVLVDQLPKNYFDDLEALAVDLLVFDELMKERLPRLHAHCRRLMKQDAVTYNYNVLDADDDPPLTSVFTGQWFPTLFANLLPQGILFRVWDAILFDGDEMMFRVALAIITMLEPQLLSTKNSLQFYEQLKEHTHDFGLTNVINCDDMIKLAYNMYPFPLPRLAELRASMAKKRSAVKPKAAEKPASEKAASPGFLRRLSLKLDGTLDSIAQETLPATESKNSTEADSEPQAINSAEEDASSQAPSQTPTQIQSSPKTPTLPDIATDTKSGGETQEAVVDVKMASTDSDNTTLQKTRSSESGKSTQSTTSGRSLHNPSSQRSAKSTKKDESSDCSNIS
ncbi:hypothetical protein SARC_03643 [Sphaeroforma arctica JP610]|uniref:Rab-GAP TBC domain-containing protein n=1 Tax=Sphaeroforma arctica JP610 TaxID=667725 RepID=A0A0L0G513_9EUKA|nr:hypothetical protein SARC_03643 [Sphaeroforma arctica JP610]KNC84122.1 hypothetical protein SARC_03643 [Sphaeroforma arctica JP610]|eukprot:XP_014158024.1 hypothetical protein SARC_03643 [Sphaeroforma arctica JP610]